MADHDPTPAPQINPCPVDPARQALRTTTVAHDVAEMASSYVAVTRLNADRAVAVATELEARGFNLHRGDIATLIGNGRVNVSVELLEQLLGLDPRHGPRRCGHGFEPDECERRWARHHDETGHDLDDCNRVGCSLWCEE